MTASFFAAFWRWGKAPRVRPIPLLPMGNRHRAAGGAPAWGRGKALGCAGAAAFCSLGAQGLPGHKTNAGAGAKAPAPALCALCAPAAPPGRCGFLPAKRSIRHPFPTSASYKQNEPAAPHERRAGIFRRKTEEVFQLVYPAFFKSGRGAEPSAASGGKSEAEAQ